MTATLRRFLLLQAAVTLVCFAVELICRFGLHLHKPYSSPMIGLPPFEDFYPIARGILTHAGSLEFFTQPHNAFQYPPAAALLYYPFSKIFWHVTSVFLIVLMTIYAAVALAFASALSRRGVPRVQAIAYVALGSLLSYPLWFELHRANIELFVWAITVVGVWAFYREKGYAAATCFGIVGAIKMYPLIFLGLFLSRRQYRPILVGLLVAGVTTLAGLRLMYPNIELALQGDVAGLSHYTDLYVRHYYPVALPFDHSVFSIYKRLTYPSFDHLGTIARFYTPIAALLGTVLFFTKIRFLPLANQVLVLTLAAALFPPVSFDYTLLNLYTPLCLLVLVNPLGKLARFSIPIFALAAAPLTELIYRGMGFGGQVRALLLCCLFVFGLMLPAPQAAVEQPA